VGGVAVGFAVTSGSATLSAPSAVTNAQGQAQVAVTAGPNIGPVVVTASAGNQSATFNLTVRAPGPSLTSDSFLNGASFLPTQAQTGGISPCSIATIRASGLAPGIQGVVAPPLNFGPLPYLLAGDKVTFGTSAAPLFSVANSNGQESVTVQVPCDVAPGSVQVTVNVSGGSNTATVQVKPASPGIFESLGADNVRRAVLVRPDGSFVDAVNNPARRGETIRLYATGLGLAAPPAGTNQIPISGIDSLITGTPIVGINNSGVQVVSAKVANNLIGVWEVAFVVPSDAPAGDLILSIGVAPADGSQVQYSQGTKISVQ